ncbi:nicotinamide N-methyltransferase-like isoform X2 [Pseudophryne corroboree]|uniref:nicotinamide N-methyltransferase-like isoform X2 n=1 Tax=Pseudophryne corroboree TaxID=495146 RepID=UPI0030813EA2
MDTPYSTSQTYIDDFNPVDYLQTYYAPGQGALTGEWTNFVLRNLHETFAPGRVEGDILIDFGAGPTIYHLLSACEVFNNIITSDFLEQNRRELQKWLKKDPDAFDWTPIVKYVCELENNSDNWREKEEKLRRKVTKVLQCDALKKNPYDPVVLPKADCLISCLCLEGPSRDLESFCNILKNCKELLKPGGHIILLNVLNCSFYYVGQKKFSYLSITKEDLERVIKEAGYELEEMKVIPRNDKSGMDLSNHDSFYYVHARKPHNQQA